MSKEHQDREESSHRPPKSSFDAYISEVRQFPQLTREEEEKLGRQLSDDGILDARDRLVNCNLRLVIAIAKRYVISGMGLMDLIEEGNLGLMKAAEKYDPTLQCRFATYAGWWIRQAILRALANQARTIRIPVYKFTLVCRFKRTRDALQQVLGRDPSEKDIARAMKISVARVQELESLVPEVVPLETQVGEEEEEVLLNMIRDDQAKIPSEVMKEIFLSEQVIGLLEALEERERTILEYRFGVGKDRSHTLSEIATILKISRERVRQIEARALKRLREGFSLMEGSGNGREIGRRKAD